MSDPTLKDLGPTHSEGNARAKLSDLRRMRSVRLLIEDDGQRVVRWSLLASREVWKLESGRGESATYVQVHEEREDT